MFCFYENFKNKLAKKRKHLFGLATATALYLCVHQKRTEQLSTSVQFWSAVYALAEQ